jgi:TonB family protein
MVNPRRYLIPFSLTVHLVLVLGLFVAGFWRIEKLDAPRNPFDLAVPGPPPPAPAGGEQQAKREPFKKKQPKTRPTVLVQPTVELVAEKPQLTTETTGTGNGSGPGSGSGSGDAKSTGDCVIDCGDPDHKPQPKPEPVVARPIPVPSSVIRGMRTLGETQIQMSDNDKIALQRSGSSVATMKVQLCISETGTVMNLGIAQKSGYPKWDAKILAAVQAWRYRPHRIGGHALAVCSDVTFSYQMK